MHCKKNNKKEYKKVKFNKKRKKKTVKHKEIDIIKMHTYIYICNYHNMKKNLAKYLLNKT